MSRFVMPAAIGLTLSLSAVAFAQQQKAVVQPAPTPVTKTATPAADDPWANRADLFVAPLSHQAAKVDLGAVQRYTLPNGLEVIAVPRHTAPVVDVVLAVRIDDAAEPLDKTGVANFTASMLHKGTAKRTSDKLADEIDSAGAKLDAEASNDKITVSCRGRARDLALCLDLTSDVTLHPTFPAAEISEIRQQFLAQVESARDNPSELAREHAANLFYGDDDPRGRQLSKRTAGAIDRDAIAQFHKDWFHPNHSIITVAGDFDPKALHTALVKWFGGWQKGEPPKVAVLSPPKPGPMKVRLIDKPDATQVHIVIVGPGIRHADPDLCAVRLMNYTLGAGAFSSRPMKVVRSENAKTYGASSHFETNREPGTFEAATFTREAEAANTTQLVLNEIDKMKKDGPTDKELVAAKANLIGGYGLNFETASDIAAQLVHAAADDLAPEFTTSYPSCLDKVSLADAAQAAKAHLAPQALVVVGNAAKLAPLLAAAKLGAQETVVYTEPVSASERNAQKAQAAKVKEAAALAPQADLDAGHKILLAALAAKGADSIGKIKDLHIDAMGSMSVQGQVMHIGFEGFYVPSKNQKREDLAVGSMDVSNVLDDKKAFVKQGLESKDLPAEQVASAHKDLWRNVHLVLLNAAAPGVQVRALPVVTSGKSKYDALNVVTPDGDSIELELDQKTHQLVKMAYTDDGQQASAVMSDYKSEGGISFARHVILDIGPQHVELSIDKVKLNRGFPADTFKR